MAADKLDIDIATIQDNPAERQVEFSGEVDADEVQFAVQYDVLEALSGDVPDEDDAIELFNRFVDQIAEAGLAALGRSSDQALIVISENDWSNANLTSWRCVRRMDWQNDLPSV